MLVLVLAVALEVEKLTLAKATGMAISFLGSDPARGRARIFATFAIADRGPVHIPEYFGLFDLYGSCEESIAMRYDAVSMNTYYVMPRA